MIKLRVGLSPYANMNPKCYPSEKTGCDAGVELDILHTLSKLGHFELEFFQTNVAGCGGNPDANGRLDGLIGMLKEGKIDLAGNLCGVTKSWQKFGDFLSVSWPVWQSHEEFVIQAPIPPRVTFAPFAPLHEHVWIGYACSYLLFVILITLHSKMHARATVVSIPRAALNSIETLNGVVTGLGPRPPPCSVSWALWNLQILSFIVFFQTFFLSAVLHPTAVRRPFTSADEMVQSLLSGSYRVLSYKNPPPRPNAVYGRPSEAAFSLANERNGWEYIENANGRQVMGRLADQPPDAHPKLVFINGKPFIDMYLGEYPQDRNRLWIIDDGFENWSSYVWLKNFTQERTFNRLIRMIGEYKYAGLRKASGEAYGSRPQTGEYITGEIREGEEAALGLDRLTAMFWMYLVGVAISVSIFVLEIVTQKLNLRFALGCQNLLNYCKSVG